MKDLMKHTTRNRKQSGFSLLEVMIGVLVMGVALLALAAMQTRMLASSNGSKMRQVATAQAYSVADAMRTNMTAFTAGTFDNPTAAATAGCMNGAGCTATQMAQTIYSNWQAQVAATLPGGTGVICLDSTPDDGDSQATPGCDGAGVLYVVKVWWVDEKLDPATPQRFVTSVMP